MYEDFIRAYANGYLILQMNQLQSKVSWLGRFKNRTNALKHEIQQSNSNKSTSRKQ